MAETLTAAGFRKSGFVFSRPKEDVVHLVSLQSSQSSTSDTLRVTVNLAVWAPTLSDGPEKPDVSASHWRERLGFLMPVRSDRWWEASSDHSASIVAAEIGCAIRDFGLPALDRLASVSALRELWARGSCPGLTDLQRRRYLERLSAHEEKG
jgi:hypothetical protein